MPGRAAAGRRDVAVGGRARGLEAERLAAGFAELGETARGGHCGAGATALRLEPVVTWTSVVGKIVSLELWGDRRDPAGNLMESMTAEELAPLLEESLGQMVPF